MKIQEALTAQHDSNCGRCLLQEMTELNCTKCVYEKLHEQSDLCLSQVKELQKGKQQ